ncbi:hypothetical protein HMPREF1051_1975 [Neisseria sicca VK64]|jgi:hypothetical protein|uniref:Uncharacterized protein n=1 Tax=Neisseria sicca VK64 TaxID=1095748 RepID=I2NU13_NEISI|nr:hypothetical protein HMPREF1051_1975 [Neisseria sicca VK64]
MKVSFDWMVYIGIETARPNIGANRLSNCRHSTVLQGMASTRSKPTPSPKPPRAKPTLHNATSPAHCHTSKGRLKKAVSRVSDDPAAAKSVYFPYRNQGAES